MYLCAVCGYKYLYFLLQRNCRVATTSCCCCNLLLLMTARSNKKRGKKEGKEGTDFPQKHKRCWKKCTWWKGGCSPSSILPTPLCPHLNCTQRAPARKITSQPIPITLHSRPVKRLIIPQLEFPPIVSQFIVAPKALPRQFVISRSFPRMCKS